MILVAIILFFGALVIEATTVYTIPLNGDFLVIYPCRLQTTVLILLSMFLLLVGFLGVKTKKFLN